MYSNSPKYNLKIVNSLSPWLELSRSREVCVGYNLFVISLSVLLGPIQIYYGASPTSEVLKDELRNTFIVSGVWQFIFVVAWISYNLYASYVCNKRLTLRSSFEVDHPKYVLKENRCVLSFLGILVTFLLLINLLFLISLVGALFQLKKHIEVYCQVSVGFDPILITQCVSSFDSWFSIWQVLLPLFIVMRIPCLLYLLFCLLHFLFSKGKVPEANSSVINNSYSKATIRDKINEDLKSNSTVIIHDEPCPKPHTYSVQSASSLYSTFSDVQNCNGGVNLEVLPPTPKREKDNSVSDVSSSLTSMVTVNSRISNLKDDEKAEDYSIKSVSTLTDNTALNIETHSCNKNEFVYNHIQTPTSGMDSRMASENTVNDDVFNHLEPDRMLVPRKSPSPAKKWPTVPPSPRLERRGSGHVMPLYCDPEELRRTSVSSIKSSLGF